MSDDLFSKAFIGLLCGRVVSTFNGSVLALAVAWHLYQNTGNAFDLALVSLTQIIPILALFLVTGWVADNYSRRNVIMLSTALQGIAIIMIAYLMNTEVFNKWWLFFALLFFSVGRAFISPAIQSIIPNIVSSQNLSRAISIYSVSWNVSLAAAPFFGGLLLLWLDLQVYWLLVISLMVSLIAYKYLPDIKLVSNKDFSMSELFGGVVYLRQNMNVLGSLALDLFIVLFGSVLVLLPVIVTDILQKGPETLGVLRAMPAIGASIVGFYLTARRKSLSKPGKSLFIALFIFSFSIVLVGVSQNIYVLAMALLIYGGSDMISVVVRGAVVQILTPDELRGRVNSLNAIFIASSNELGDFRAATLATFIGPVNSILIGGAMAFAVTAGGLVLFKELYRMDRLVKREE
ncbi:MAG: MFS transporter [Pseudomonadota bacterium]